MQTTPVVSISRFRNARDITPTLDAIDVDRFVRELSEPRTLDVSAAAYFSGGDSYQKQIKTNLPAFSPATFRAGRTRSKDAVDSLSLVVLDCDQETCGIGEIEARMLALGLRGAIHTTLSDRGGGDGSQRCYRVVLVADRPMLPDEYSKVWEECARLLQVSVDQSTKDPSRMYFLPARLDGGTFEACDVPGALLNVGETLATIAARAVLSDSTPDTNTNTTTNTDKAKAQGKGAGAVSVVVGGGALQEAERATFAQALDYIAASPGFPDAYDTWRNTGFAICHAYGKTADGLELFDTFSRASNHYDGAELRDLWGRAKPDGGITYDWVFKQAAKLGWRNPGKAPGKMVDTAKRLTEDALAARLLTRCGARFTFASDSEQIFFQRDGKWQPDMQGRALLDEYRAMLREMIDEAKESLDGKRLEHLAKAIQGTLERRTTIDNIAALFARGLRLCLADDFDADALLLGVRNGVLDLNTGKLISEAEIAARGALVSRSLAAAFTPAAQCPQWEKFISVCCSGDADMADYLQDVAGSCLLGSNRRRNLFIVYGTGGNGKSVFLNTLSAVLGEYAAMVNKGALLKRERSNAANYELAGLVGARFVTCSETSSGEVLDDALVKQVTGGDKVVVRQIYGKPCEITPRFTLALASNHRPVIRDNSEGLWDRLRLVPFTNRIPDTDIDRGLPEKLAAEAAGILNWLLVGFERWYSRDMVFSLPAIVEAATAAYRHEQDTLGLWLEECAVCPPDATAPDASKTGAALLHASYTGWCGLNGFRALSRQAFAQRLEERGFPKRKTKTAAVYSGIALKEAAEINAEQYQRDLAESAVSRAR